MQSSLKVAILNALSNVKALNINALAVGNISSFTDHMIIATGTSTRHVKSISAAVLEETKKLDHQPLGVEGEKDAEWILIDLGDIVVHVMLSTSRAFFQLEKLWDPVIGAASAQASH